MRPKTGTFGSDLYFRIPLEQGLRLSGAIFLAVNVYVFSYSIRTRIKTNRSNLVIVVILKYFRIPLEQGLRPGFGSKLS